MKHVLIGTLLVLGIMGVHGNALAEPEPEAPPMAAPMPETAPPPPAAPREYKNSVTLTYGNYRLLRGSTDFMVTTGHSCSTTWFFVNITTCGPTLSSVPAAIDTASRQVFGLEYERAIKHGFSYGATLFQTTNTIATPTGTPTQGVVKTTFILATLNKYFGSPGGLQPFVGVGIGMASSHVGGGINTDGGGTPVMARFGVRYQVGRISVKAGYRTIHANSELSANMDTVGAMTGGYSMSGRGLYAGVGVHF